MRVRFTVIAVRVSHTRTAVGERDGIRSRRMRIGVPKETAAGEHRVALVPEVVSKLRAKGLDVLVQSGAGADALIPDAAYAQAGAQIIGTTEHPEAGGHLDLADVWGAD